MLHHLVELSDFSIQEPFVIYLLVLPVWLCSVSVEAVKMYGAADDVTKMIMCFCLILSTTHIN